MQIVVKLKDVIIDPAKPVDLTAMSAEKAIELLRKAYGFLAANMTFEIRDEMVVITVDYERRQDEEVAKDCFDRGMKQATSGRYNKAVDLFTRALKIVPEHTEARRNLAMALMNAQRFAEAKDQLVDVLRLSPDDVWGYVLLGNIFAKHENDLETGERFYRKALELDPQDSRALINYAALKTERKDPEGARALFEQAIVLDPRPPNPYYGLAMLVNDAGKTAESLAVLDRMFDDAKFDDVRMADLRKECREFYLRLSAQVADTDHDRLWKDVLAYRDQIAGITACPVDLIEDNCLEDTTATSVPAWRGEPAASMSSGTTRAVNRSCRTSSHGNWKPSGWSTRPGKPARRAIGPTRATVPTERRPSRNTFAASQAATQRSGPSSPRRPTPLCPGYCFPRSMLSLSAGCGTASPVSAPARR